MGGGTRGEQYAARFAELAASGMDVHGEARLVASLAPAGGCVLDAGCGTGRVGIELARQGFHVVGVDVDASMIAVARRDAPHVRWENEDLASLDLDERFDVVVMAGNVVVFVTPGHEPAAVAHCAAHLVPNGLLVVGFQLGRVSLDDYDAWCTAAGLAIRDRWATWDRDPYTGGDYAVSVHAMRDFPS